jgi:adenylate cyclase
MIEFRTLGGLELRRHGTEVRSVLSQPKRLALLAYLAVATPRGYHSRDRLLALFWPESDAERARNSLRQALFQLRRSLGESAITSRNERDVGVDASVVRCDAAAFDDAVSAERWEEALALYGGEFLPGVYVEEAPEAEQWLEGERTRRRRSAAQCARTLADAAAGSGELAVATIWARRALEVEPSDEGALRSLLLLLEECGEVVQAVAAFGEFERRLRDEYDLPPAPETVALVDRIRAREPGESAPPERLRRAVTDDAIPEPVPAEPAMPPARTPSTSTLQPPAQPQATPARTPSTSEPPAPATTPVHALSAARRVRRRWLVAATLILTIGVSAAAAVNMRRASVADGDVPSIAVLPFLNLSGDPEREYFSDGLAEELLNVLAQLPTLRVASRTSSFRYRGSEVPVDSIGRALGVEHVLEGSVRQEGTRVRITAQLIDAETGYHLWSQTYDRELTDIFHVQDEISRAIVNELRVRLGGRRGPLVRQETVDPEAHALVLRGSYVLARQNDRAGLEQAAAFFRDAAYRDSSYARAWAGLASAVQSQAYRRYVPTSEGYATARSYAQRALALDPAQIRAHMVLARIAEIHDWDFAAAEEHYRIAAELNPHNSGYLAGRAFLLLRLGRSDEAIEVIRRYVALEPDKPNSHTLVGAVYGYSGRFTESLAAFRTALSLDPHNPTAQIGVTLTASYMGRFDDAIAAGEAVRAQSGEDQYVLSALGYAYARAGRQTDAESALAALRQQSEPSAYLQAVILAGLDHRDEALRLLEKSLDQREDAAPDMGIDPSFANLRNDPRLEALLKRIGLAPPGARH